ncbi:MAG: sigma-70 family RNA polymerase sigma factor [Planctomycetota bacterium]
MDQLLTHGDALRRTARAVLGSDADGVDDVVQEVWLRVASRPRLAKLAPAFLHGIARNVARMRRRSRTVESDALAARARDDHEIGELDPAAASETAVALASAVDGLPEHYREVVVRRYWRGERVASIAADLGVPPKTVSNRLARALASLRVALESGPGARTDHRLGLAWLAAPALRDVALPALAMKSIAPPALAAALACALVLTFLGLGRRDAQLAGRSAERDTADLASVEPDAAAPDVELASVEDVPTERSAEVATEESAESVALAPAAVPRIDPGTVELRFVEAVTREPVDGVELRGATEERYVTFEAEANHSMTLTPGTWTFVARRAPYEYVELDPIVVTEGGSVDAGVIELRGGWGSITGQVDVPARVAATGPFEVRLFGKGRRPCDDRAVGESDRCLHCGHGEKNTIRTVEAMELFQIDGLAAGQYSALVYDAKGRILFNLQVELETGEAARLDLRMDFVDVDFRIADASGQPFTRVWEEDGTTYEGPIEFYFGADGTACATASTQARSAVGILLDENGEASFEERKDRVFLRDPAVIARERAARKSMQRVMRNAPPPALALESVQLEEMIRKAHSDALLRAQGGAPEPLAPLRPEAQDWPKTEHEDAAFAPWSVEPQVETRPLKAKQIAVGLFRVEQVPVQADGVLVTCGPFYENVDIDLRTQGGVPIDVTLGLRCNAPSKMFVGARSCFECHTADAVAAMTW